MGFRIMIYHHGRTYSQLLHLNLRHDSGYVVQYYKTGQYLRNHPTEAGPRRTDVWHEARVMSLCDAEYYERHYLEGCIKIRVKD